MLSDSCVFAGFRLARLLLICLVCAPFANSVMAADQTETSESRPKIGLVLAGGGAKGAAHVGVLKVMEELHVPIDCIAGTSMGALVGAGYASGIPADELEEFVTGINWQEVVGGVGQRNLQPIEQKRAGVTYSNNFEMGLQDGGLTIPGGLVDTMVIEDLLRSYVAEARMQPNFDRLPIPFRAVATDMVTGEMVVIGGGDIATAMRASMAMPGVFAPVVIDDKILSDGGLVRNIPVDVARDLCADVVIVVNLVEPEVDPSKLRSAAQILSRSTDVMIIANEELQLATLTADDVRIDVEMGGIGTGDFEDVPRTIPLGEQAARSASAVLSQFAVPEDQYLAWRTRVTEDQEIEARLAGVTYEGLEYVNPAYLEQAASVKAGDVVDTSEISADARRISALQDFESVSYRLDGDKDEPTLVWLPKEKGWGPNYLNFDLGLYGSGDGDLAFVVYAKHKRTWLNALGAEWRNEAQLGYESQLSTSFYQPLENTHTLFVEPSIGWYRTVEDVFSDGDRVATYQFQDYRAVLDVGANLGAYAQIRLGYKYDDRKVSVDTGAPVFGDNKYKDAGLMASITYDSRDNPFNASRGVAFSTEYMDSDESLGADREWKRLEAGLGAALPVRRDIVWLTLGAGSNQGSDLPEDRYFSIGGPGSFPGYQLGEVRSEKYWIASASYLWEVKQLVSLLDQSLYTGFRLTAGEFNGRLDLVDEGPVYGGAFYLTGRTMVGPLTLGLGANTEEAVSLWLSAGRPIGHGTILERGIFR